MNTIVRTVSAADLPESDSSPALVGMFFRDNESKYLRLISAQAAEYGQHYRDEEETGSRRPFLCLGADCAACYAGKSPVTMFALPALYVATRTLCALSYGNGTGPDSLRRLIAQVLRLPDFTQKIINVTLKKKKYSVDIQRTITAEEDGERWGLDVIKAAVERNAITPEALISTVDHLSNAEMIAEWPSLRGEIELRHPHLDIGSL